jgi:putative nucleotidyltransferase with HDIG domain
VAPVRANLVAYTASTAIAALVLVAWALPRVDPATALTIVLAVLIAEAFASTFRDQVHVSLSNIVILVAILIGGAELALVGALGAIPVILVQTKDMRLIRTAFNSGQLVISAAVGGLIYEMISGPMGGSFPDWITLLAILVAALADSVVNHALVAGVISVSTVDRFLDTFRTVRTSIAMQVPYVGIAVLTVVVLDRASIWALVLMAVPALIARYGLMAFEQLDKSYDTLVKSFVKAIEIKDLYTRGHSERVAELSVHVATEMGVGYDERRLTRYAALLHDVGKIGVPLCIINKPGPLDDDEFAEIKKHPTIGAEILRDIDFLAPAIDIVRYHHERLDGRGYPHGVDETELTGIVRIVTAVDAFDAMTSTRSYRRAMSVDAAVEELRRCAGRQFDPEVVEALARCVVRVGWEPLTEFASEAELHGHDIPVGTAQERLEPDSQRQSSERHG